MAAGQPQYRLTTNGGFLIEHGRIEKISLAILAAKPGMPLYVKPSGNRNQVLTFRAPWEQLSYLDGDQIIEPGQIHYPDWIGTLQVLVRSALPPTPPTPQEDPA